VKKLVNIRDNLSANKKLFHVVCKPWHFYRDADYVVPQGFGDFEFFTTAVNPTQLKPAYYTRGMTVVVNEVPYILLAMGHLMDGKRSRYFALFSRMVVCFIWHFILALTLRLSALCITSDLENKGKNLTKTFELNRLTATTQMLDGIVGKKGDAYMEKQARAHFSLGVHLFICSICDRVFLSCFCLFVCLFIYLFICWFVCLFVCLTG
jgi:hypothetical protein